MKSFLTSRNRTVVKQTALGGLKIDSNNWTSYKKREFLTNIWLHHPNLIRQILIKSGTSANVKNLLIEIHHLCEFDNSFWFNVCMGKN